MTWIKNSSKVSGGNYTDKALLRKGQIRMFDSFKAAYDFCVDNNIDTDAIQAKYKSFKVEI